MQSGAVVEHYRKVIGSIYHRYRSELTPEKGDELAGGILEICQGSRWYQLASDDQIQAIWAQVRNNEVILDYVMAGSAQFKMLACDNDMQWKNAVAQLVASLAWIATDPFIDDSLKERAPEREWLNQVFSDCHWLTFLYLHSTIAQK